MPAKRISTEAMAGEGRFPKGRQRQSSRQFLLVLGAILELILSTYKKTRGPPPRPLLRETRSLLF